MTRPRFILSALLLTLSLASVRASLPFSNETLTYKVLYKWGLIHKQAGTANFSITRSGNELHATVTARSAKWADKFYHLRDTFYSHMSATDLAPLCYERIAHEDGKYSRDKLVFHRSDNTFNAYATRWRRKKNKTETTTATLKLTAEGMTVDLLTSFYYLRSLPFSTLTPGYTKRVNIFSGKRKELLDLTYKGIVTLKLDNVSYRCYKVLFTFTSDGRKQSSDPIEVWISTDGRYIPLKLVGKLKIGSVQCIYTGSL